MAASGEDKTETPTAKKRADARREGQLARTPELGSWIALLAVALVLGPLIGREVSALRALTTAALRQLEEPTVPAAMEILRQGAAHVLVSTLMLAGVVLLVSFLAAVAQGGFVMAPKAVKPKLSKLSLIQGTKRLFGVQALWQGAKMLLKSTVVAIFVWRSIAAIMPLVGGFVPMDAVLEVIRDSALGLFRTIGLVGVVFAVADYAITKRRHEKQLKMTKTEVKQEHKNVDGDPLIKAAIRAKQREMSRNRMMSSIAEGDVLLVNPTHIAIVLKYDPALGAPRVVARGAGAVATKIRLEAAAHRLPLVRDVPLTRALYRSCQVGHEIPRELWAAVAQVLAFVMTRRNQGQYGGEHRSPRLDVDQPLPDLGPAGRRRTREHLA